MTNISQKQQIVKKLTDIESILKEVGKRLLIIENNPVSQSKDTNDVDDLNKRVFRLEWKLNKLMNSVDNQLLTNSDRLIDYKSYSEK